jgi:hypothetical protein
VICKVCKAVGMLEVHYLRHGDNLETQRKEHVRSWKTEAITLQSSDDVTVYTSVYV